MTHFDRIHTQIQQDLKQLVDPDYKNRSISFSKQTYQSYGVRTPKVRKVAAQYWKKIKSDYAKQVQHKKRVKINSEFKKYVFDVAENLLATKINEEMTIAWDWVYRLKNHYSENDYKVFYSWLEKYVDTWFYCDDFCCRSFGVFIYQFPDLAKKTLNWAESENMWLRRASAVVLIYSLRRNKQLELALQIADKLLKDEEDLVQKGYGWMLKEATKCFEDQIFSYVLKHKEQMPRTALRYAIEKLSTVQKKQAMN